MPTLPAGESAYGGFPSATVAGANRTTVQTPFTNQVTPGLDFRKARLDKHRLNRTIQAQTATAVVNPTVAVATDAINAVRAADRVPAALVNGKRTGRVRRLEQGAVAAFSGLIGGTGYTNGSYTNVPLRLSPAAANNTRASGGCSANITVAGGIVTACTVNRVGAHYSVGQVLSSDFIGPGASFAVTVATIIAG